MVKVIGKGHLWKKRNGCGDEFIIAAERDEATADARIVELYYARDPQVIDVVTRKYGKLCTRIACGILSNREDAEECVSDVMLSLWNGIPPAKPERFHDYLIASVRLRAYSMLKARNAQKRGGGTVPAALNELLETARAAGGTESEFDCKELSRLLNKFIAGLPEVERIVFIRRIWFLNSIGDIADALGFTESKVKSMLYRTREKLRKYLHDEGGYLYEEM